MLTKSAKKNIVKSKQIMKLASIQNLIAVVVDEDPIETKSVNHQGRQKSQKQKSTSAF